MPRGSGVRVLADDADIEKPLLDKRQYRVILLPNKLEAVLIHDAKTNRSAASLGVGVGCNSDDKDMPGMAHAVEHMLFMGSEKYPSESGWDDYIQGHSGEFNACTSSDSTKYFFALPAFESSSEKPVESTFLGALDRFADMFKSPLLRQDAVRREMQAIESEFQIRKANDDIRSYQLERSLSSPKHPANSFDCGNYKTLYEIPMARNHRVRDRLDHWFRTNYSADRMKLVVIGRESLNQLERWIYRLFTPIPNRNYGPVICDQPRWRPGKETGTQLFVQRLSEERDLQVMIPVSDLHRHWRSYPNKVLIHVLNHEGKGSLDHLLESLGLSTVVSSGFEYSTIGESYVDVTVSLTPLGLRRYRDVVRYIFEHIGMIAYYGPDRDLYDELFALERIAFKFQEPAPPLSTTLFLVAHLLVPCDRNTVLDPGMDCRFDPVKIQSLYRQLQPQNARIILRASGDDLPVKPNRTEPMYGAEYRLERIEQSFILELETAYRRALRGRFDERLRLPDKNRFLPKSLSVTPVRAQSRQTPRLIRHRSGVRTWWRKDDKHFYPRVKYGIILRIESLTSAGWLGTVLELWIGQVIHAANIDFYGCGKAGCSYELSYSSGRINISTSGYNDSAIYLLGRLLDKMISIEIDPSLLRLHKQSRYEDVRSCLFDTTAAQTFRWDSHVFTARSPLPSERLAVLTEVTVDDLERVAYTMIRQAHIEILAYGNVDRETAIAVTDLVCAKLRPAVALAPERWPVSWRIEIPRGANYLFRARNTNPGDTGNMVLIRFHAAHHDDMMSRAVCRVFAGIAFSPAFDTLRTKEQLGYAVQACGYGNDDHHGYLIAIESGRHPDEVEDRIEAFLSAFEDTIRSLEVSKLEAQKDGLVRPLLAEDATMGEEYGRIFEAIASETYDFEHKRLAKAIRNVSKADILWWYQKYVKPCSPHRTKTVVQVMAQDAAGYREDRRTKRTPRTAIKEPREFWHSLGLGKPTLPVNRVEMFEDLDPDTLSIHRRSEQSRPLSRSRARPSGVVGDRAKSRDRSLHVLSEDQRRRDSRDRGSERDEKASRGAMRPRVRVREMRTYERVR